MRSLIIFEPENLAPFGPLALLRSLAELRYGIYSNLERAQKIFLNDSIALWVRPILKNDHVHKYPMLQINETAAQNTIFLNAALPAWMYPGLVTTLDSQNSGLILKDGVILAAKPGSTLNFSRQFHRKLADLAPLDYDPVQFASFPRWIWDYLDLISTSLDFDLQLWKNENDYLTKLPAELSTLDDRNILIHNTAQISKYVHLDASHGPIIIDSDCKISPFSALEGPLYLGKRSAVKPATSIRHSVIGEVCNLGGEIKGSIIHPYSNKSHSGFLGDSILGSWINLGADTNTSNLKNNYQPIRVSWDGNNYDTNRQFLGTILGDHSKTAIGIRLNTGTLIGPFCNVFQEDFPPRAIPSFSWGNGTHELDKAIGTAQRVLNRRNLNLSATREELIRALAADNTPFTHF
ncbi:MAG: putative sugar nucleotidyl transferase [Candidatus Marinimicrobia bacterium]|nr:putative sugar nucleotidyl transferase [Candidatus Neomarinimicrobiota bacterium]